MVNTNEIIFRAFQRLGGDPELMARLAAGTGAINGPRRPEGARNPCLTIGVLTNTVIETPKHHRVTLNVVVYFDNLSSSEVRGQPDSYHLALAADRVEALLDRRPLEMSDVINSQLVLSAKLGPLFDPQSPDEHYMALRFRATLR